MLGCRAGGVEVHDAALGIGGVAGAELLLKREQLIAGEFDALGDDVLVAVAVITAEVVLILVGDFVLDVRPTIKRLRVERDVIRRGRAGGQHGESRRNHRLRPLGLNE
ncbi:hypothetical protein [uncultured Sutterella sp.]|uniref:hypothetical protein n=1 Tax=uncultured Sutterella sp. TaxID=286133 RepID=UPI0025FE7AA3|nr:hypothetical protein [uncultured Sutterella sp.]